MDVTSTSGEPRHDIPPPPRQTGIPPAPAGPYVANPFEYDDPAPAAGQLAPGWKKLFIFGWAGVLIGFGCIWQAARVTGIAPWWLGPATRMRAFSVVALPFLPALVAIAAAAARLRSAVYIGLLAGVASAAISLGDYRDYPGLAVGEASIGLAGLLVSVACLAGRMRPDLVLEELNHQAFADGLSR